MDGLPTTSHSTSVTMVTTKTPTLISARNYTHIRLHPPPLFPGFSVKYSLIEIVDDPRKR